MSDTLIKEYEVIDGQHLSDHWMEVARLIEQSLIQSGAIANKDYTFLDLYKLAQPIVLENLKKGDVSLG